jgi:hypothetical protein
MLVCVTISVAETTVARSFEGNGDGDNLLRSRITERSAPKHTNSRFTTTTRYRYAINTSNRKVLIKKMLQFREGSSRITLIPLKNIGVTGMHCPGESKVLPNLRKKLI